MRMANGSGRLCRLPAFQAFMASLSGRPVCNDAQAAVELRVWCNVTTRKAFDTDPDASAAYVALVSRFNTWLNQRHKEQAHHGC